MGELGSKRFTSKLKSTEAVIWNKTETLTWNWNYATDFYRLNRVYLVLGILIRAFQAFRASRAFQALRAFQAFQAFWAFQACRAFQAFWALQDFRAFELFDVFELFELVKLFKHFELVKLLEVFKLFELFKLLLALIVWKVSNFFRLFCNPSRHRSNKSWEVKVRGEKKQKSFPIFDGIPSWQKRRVI